MDELADDDAAGERCNICLDRFPAESLTTDATLPPTSTISPPDLEKGPTRKRKRSATPENDLIAVIQPCKHCSHDSCLKRWANRANSCPSCRAKFNVVELTATLGGKSNLADPNPTNPNLTEDVGPVVDSYVVQDRNQVADADPGFIVDREDGGYAGLLAPCMVCEEYGDENLLMSCNGCGKSCHFQCSGLDDWPDGSWYCDDCRFSPDASQRRRRVRNPLTRSILNGNTTNTTRGQVQRRRRRGRNDGSADSASERLWTHTMNGGGLNLDSPHNSQTETRGQERLRRRQDELARTYGNTEQQLAAEEARRTAAALSGRLPAPPPSATEELQMWTPFERAARNFQSQAPSNGRGRRSGTCSPVERPVEPERRLKRPKRFDAADSPAEISGGESARLNRPTTRGPMQLPSRRDGPDPNGGQPFLRSLLAEIGSNPTTALPSTNTRAHGVAQTTAQGVEILPAGSLDGQPFKRDVSPYPSASSPASPSASSYASPFNSPPLRPSSPTPISSSILPVYPQLPGTNYAPGVDRSGDRGRLRKRTKGRDRSPSRSPGRRKLKPATKDVIKDLVVGALNSYKEKNELDPKSYEKVRKSATKVIADMVALRVDSIRDLDDLKTNYRNFAKEEVDKAVAELISSRESENAGNVAGSYATTPQHASSGWSDVADETDDTTSCAT